MGSFVPGAKIEKLLFVKYDEGEALKVSREAAALAGEVSKKKDQLKSMQKSMKADIDKEEDRVDTMLNCVKNNGDFKDVVCSVYYDRPSAGQAMVIRDDTGETVDLRAMTVAEMQRVLDFTNQAEREGKALVDRLRSDKKIQESLKVLRDKGATIEVVKPDPVN